MSVFAGGHLINMTPSIAKPIVGTVAGYVANRHLAICKSIGSLAVMRRLGMNQLKKEGKCTWEPKVRSIPCLEPLDYNDAHVKSINQNDGLQWVIDMCHDTGDLKQLDPALIVHRLLTLNNAIVHSASLALTNTILDLYSSPSYTAFLEALREESKIVLAACGGLWNKDAVAKLHHIDSTIRESMRLSVFSVAFFHRRV